MTRTFILKARRHEGEPDFLKELNEEQLAVAMEPAGPMLVIAGAGTGKTRALTYRLARLIHHGVEPSRTMLVTFTTRAAREMLHRVELLVQQKTREIWGGTFHHLANRVLRLYGSRLGISPDFNILDREDSGDLIAACVVDSKVKIEKRRFPQRKLLATISSFLQNTLEPLDTVLQRRYPMFVREADEIRTVLDLYARRKHDRQLLDYDDLLTGWLLLLTDHAEVRDALAEQFLHVLVDEYQDTNALQGRICDLLAAKHRNICVVGDDAQSIYSFRGANFENILRFTERYPDAKSFRLETNYRSTPEILALANASIAVNKRRLEKDLRPTRLSGPRPAVVPCADHTVQAQFVAEYVLYMLDKGRKLNDIAVLYRSHWNALEIQLEMQRRNIPFQVRGGLRFFEQAHIKDAIAFLRILHNPRDEIAWMRAMQLMPRIGSGLARRVWEQVGSSPDPVQAAMQPACVNTLPAPAQKFYLQFLTLLRDLARLGSPAEMLDHLMVHFYDDFLLSHYDAAPLRREDIRAMANFAAQYSTLERFITDIALAGDFSGESVVTGPEEFEFVILSTVHQAKGLEWPIVIIPWLADGRFPTDMAINTPEEEEEERRVFHVAVTRAKDEVILVTPKLYRSRQLGLVIMKPSRFLTELPDSLTEPMLIQQESLPETLTGPRPLPENSD